MHWRDVAACDDPPPRMPAGRRVSGPAEQAVPSNPTVGTMRFDMTRSPVRPEAGNQTDWVFRLSVPVRWARARFRCGSDVSTRPKWRLVRRVCLVDRRPSRRSLFDAHARGRMFTLSSRSLTKPLPGVPITLAGRKYAKLVRIWPGSRCGNRTGLLSVSRCSRSG